MRLACSWLVELYLDGEWVDVADRIFKNPGPSFGVTRGRRGDRAQITGGTASFVLENNNRDFDPRNAAGPYFGFLNPGVPVRIQSVGTSGDGPSLYGFALYGISLYGVGGGGSTEGIFKGVVEAWPQTTDGDQITVEIKALDALAQAATLTGPLSAWEATIGELAQQPDGWWRPGADGWIDRVTGASARHTSALVSVDSLVDGGDESWMSANPGEGVGVAEAGGRVVTGIDGEPFMVAMWVRFDGTPASDERCVVLQEGVDRRTDLALYINPDGFAAVYMGSPGNGTYFWITNEAGVPSTFNINDGRSHLIVLDGGPDITVGGDLVGKHIRLWIDGRERELFEQYGLPYSATADVGTLYLGGATTGRNDRAIVGTLDHVVIWNNHPYTDTMAEVAADLTAAGRVAWAGDALDERLGRIADFAGLPTGAADSTGTLIGSGYRTDSALTLLQAIENTEQGRVWCDRLGDLRLSRRSWAWSDERSTTVQAWFSDARADLDSTALPMIPESLVIVDDPRRVTNDAQVTSLYGRTQSASSPESIAANGKRTQELSGLLHASDRQSLSIAEWIVLSGGDPRPRVAELTFRVEDHPDLLLFAQTVDEGDLVKTTRSGAEYLGHVIGVAHDASNDGWYVTLSLDPTRTGWQFFEWGASTWGGDDGWAF